MTPEQINEAIKMYEDLRDATKEDNPTHLDAVERIERLTNTLAYMEEGMEYWPAYVKARMDQGYDH